MYDSPQAREENVLRSCIAETVLSCSKARYYNPSIGWFVSEDPMRSPPYDLGAEQLYTYVQNSPILSTDPLGLIAIGYTTSQRARGKIEQAISTLQREAGKNCCGPCSAYFANQPNIELAHLCDWIQNGGPPFVHVVKCSPNQRGFGYAQPREPFVNIFICESSIDKPEFRLPCPLASLILHEAGHLARKDTKDNEPPEFFRACKMGCLEPGKFH